MRPASPACYTMLRISARVSMPPMPAPPSLPSDHPRSLKTHVSASECRTIEARAARAGLSVSGYLRATALGRAVHTRGMSDAVDALCDLEARLSSLSDAIREAAAAAGCTEWVADPLAEVDAARVRLAETAGAL